MQKSTKALIILAVPFLIGIFFGFLIGLGVGRHSTKERKVRERKARTEVVAEAAEAVPADTTEDAAVIPEEDVEGLGSSSKQEIIYYTRKINYPQAFGDVNDLHIEMARKVGLRGIPQTRADVNVKKNLVEIKDCDWYVVDELRYSMPYLTPGAAGELQAIGKAFADSLASHKFPSYKLVVSSLLRTEEDVTRLRRSGNPNASDNSAHCYGTTFDLTYTRYFQEEETEQFMQPYELTKVLAEVLRDRKSAGKVLVKYERSEHCFHITSTTGSK